MQGAVLRFASPTTSLRQSRSKENQVPQVRLRPRVPAADHIIGRFETALYFVKRDSLFRVIATRNRSSGVKYALDALSFAVSAWGWSGRALTAVQARPRGEARGSLGAHSPNHAETFAAQRATNNPFVPYLRPGRPAEEGVSAAAIFTGPPASKGPSFINLPLQASESPCTIFRSNTRAGHPHRGLYRCFYLVTSAFLHKRFKIVCLSTFTDSTHHQSSSSLALCPQSLHSYSVLSVSFCGVK